jgi:hypothetical protein
MLNLNDTLYFSSISFNSYYNDVWNNIYQECDTGGKFYINIAKRLNPCRFVTRHGEWSLPWKQELIPGFEMPAYDANFSKSFDQVTDERALEIKKRILELREFHKNYGYRRLAIALNLNKKRVRRICKKYQIQIHRKASKPFKVSSQELNKYPNLLKNLSPLTENIVWATDFTYLKYKDKFFYLATFIDIYTRKIVGFSISDKHDTDLILKAFYGDISKFS